MRRPSLRVGFKGLLLLSCIEGRRGVFIGVFFRAELDDSGSGIAKEFAGIASGRRADDFNHMLIASIVRQRNLFDP